MTRFWMIIPSFMILFCILLFSFSLQAKQPRKVVIAGASSSVGYITFQKLLLKKSFAPVGIVKDRKGYNELLRLGINDEQIRICDITKKGSLSGVFDGAEQVIICTSSIPRKKLSYKAANFFRSIVGKGIPPSTESFYYEKGQRPYEVDYIGQKNIVDECLRAKVEHVVLLGNMGGYRGSKLNDIGRTKDDPDNKNGNMLKWKRAAERYLMKRCYFTILHAAQFTDEPGGQREIIWDTDDALLRTNFKKIPREDVAEVLVQALIWKEAIGRSIDISSKPVSAASSSSSSTSNKSSPAVKPTTRLHSTDWLSFWSKPGDCIYPSDFDDSEFN